MKTMKTNPQSRHVKWLLEGSDWTYLDWFPRIPNIVHMELGEGKLDDFWMEKGGIAKGLPREMKFISLDENDSMNKYSLHMMKRLDALFKANKIEKYWNVAWYLIRHSKVFFSISLRHVYPQWYKHWELWKLKSVIKSYKKKVNTLKFRTARMYIPKNDGTLRPIGIPSMVDRLIQTLFSKFLWWTIKDKLPNNQHISTKKRSSHSLTTNTRRDYKIWKHLWIWLRRFLW